MDYLKQINALEQDCTQKLEFAKIGLSQLKKEGKRMLSLVGKYENIKKNETIATKDSISSYDLSEIEEYGDLASKQFYEALKPLHDHLLRQKMEIAGLSKQIKAKPTDDYKLQVQRAKGGLTQFEGEWVSVWREQHFLMLNYRLDICAKQVQRWSIIMSHNKQSEQDVKNKVNGLFS